MLRVAVERRGRSQVVHAPNGELWVGRDRDCGVRLEHPEVLGRHARVLARRGQAVLVPLGRARIHHRSRHLSAPVVLPSPGRFDIGPFHLEARVVEEATEPLPEDLIELDHPETGVRRGWAPKTSSVWTVASDADAEAWAHRWRDHHPGARVTRLGQQVALVVRVGVGCWASELEAAVDEGTIRLPREALLILTARLLDALGARSVPHGAVFPQTVWLGRDGEAVLMPPGPRPDATDPLEQPFFSPLRRAGQPPTLAADRYAVSMLIRRLDPDGTRPSWLETAIAEGAGADHLLALATDEGMDPAAHHLGRAVSLLHHGHVREAD